MRFVVGLLACAGAVNLALADDPPPAVSATAAATAASPSTPDAPKTTPAETKPAATVQEDSDDKQLLAAGYHTQMRHGQKLYCRREEEPGSRLGGQMTCGTAADLKRATTAGQDALNKVQRNPGVKPGS